MMYDVIEEVYGDQIRAELQANTLANKAMFATNLLAAGDAPEKIARCAELPLEEVLRIKAARESGAGK